MLAPVACPMGTRQLFTSIPSKRTEHEPHSPSPHPSFVPVNPKSFRSTSNNLSMGCASTFFLSLLTMNETSHLVSFSGEEFMPSLAPETKHLAQQAHFAVLQTNLPVAMELNRSERQSHLPRHSRLPALGHPWAILRCPWRHARHERCQALQKIRGSAAGLRKSA